MFVIVLNSDEDYCELTGRPCDGACGRTEKHCPYLLRNEDIKKEQQNET